MNPPLAGFFGGGFVSTGCRRLVRLAHNARDFPAFACLSPDIQELESSTIVRGRDKYLFVKEPRTRATARTRITVQSSEAKPYDETASPALIEIRIRETFAGDIDGESTVRALQILRHDKSASLVSVQRVLGTLGGRQGTFVLQGSELVEDGKIKATWFVVPGSGTGALSGLRGEGGFEGQFGKTSDGTLEYWFE
ncbi:MAG: DUF3224 domain-containing protein [Gemmatimonadaceae bacterium]